MAVIPIRDVPGEAVEPSGNELILIDNGITMQKATINDAVTPKATEIADDRIAALNLGTAAQADVGDFATAAQGDLADSAVQPGDLAAVATSGDYNDLANLPTLGTAAAADVGDFAPAAQAVPTGGSSGQVLAKASGDDNDVEWTDAGAGDMLKRVYDPRGIEGDAYPYNSKAEAEAATIPATVQAIQLLGYAAAGDGGGALYKRVGSEPAHAGKIQSADGAWWEIAEEVLRPEMFGAKGDGDGAGNGAADETAIQNTLDAAGGKVIELDGSKIYKCLAALRMPSNTTIRFNGAQLDYSALTATNDDFGSDIKLCMYAKGEGRVASSALTANAAVAAYTVSVADGSIFAPGDWVQITAENFYTYDGSTNVKVGECIQVQSVSGNDVTFRTPLLNGYTTANTATLHKLSFAENIHLDRPAIIGSNVEGDRMEAIRLLWVKNFSIKNVSVKDVDLRCVHIANSIIGDIDDGYIDGVRYTGAGTTFYAVTLNNSVQWVTIRAIKAQEVRHLYVNSSSTTDYGQPLFITVDDCHLWNAMSGDQYASYAYEHHGFGRFITISNCTANGCHSGVRIEGPDIKVIGCTFRNVRFFGVSIETGNVKDIQISNCRVSYQTGEHTSMRAGLGIALSGAVAIENILVEGLQIDRFFDSTNGGCFGVRIGVVTSARNVVLNGLSIFAASAAADTDYGVYSEAPNITINNPKIHNYRRAFRLQAGANGVTINNPEISNDAVVGTAPAIYVAANDTVVRGPTIRTAYRAVQVVAGATDTIVAHKISKGVANADSDAGTGTIITSGTTT